MTSDTPLIGRPLDPAALLGGRDDDAVVELVTKAGISDVLRAIFDGMAEAYQPAEGPQERSIVHWEIQDPVRGMHRWETVVSPDGLSVRPEPVEEPDLTLRMEIIPFLRLMARELRGLEVLCSGIIKVKGSLRLAMGIEGWFPDPGREADR